jgi:carbonic anhydrase/acetyltransferase-like protein (isoleucine patch superfamily)
VGASFAFGEPALLVAALMMMVLGGVMLFTGLGQNLLAHLPGAALDPRRAHIGMGATVAADATVEPGASVEMGADVRAGAVVRASAVVRMGSTVGKGAVIESGAVVSWGADVKEGAVVEAGAVIGAGATVGPGARVPAGTRLLPGSTFSRGMSRPSSSPAPGLVADPRHHRVDAACDRLEADFARTPGNLRAFLSQPGQTIASLRSACHALLAREQRLRAEATPEALERLELERAVLAARAASSSDEVVRRSLEGAVAAIVEQQRQRASLTATADRLDAEATRLVLTLEGMSAQVVRLTEASGENAAPTPQLAGSVKQLHDEIDAVAQALEGLAAEDRHLPPIAPTAAPPEEGSAAPVRVRD